MLDRILGAVALTDDEGMSNKDGFLTSCDSKNHSIFHPHGFVNGHTDGFTGLDSPTDESDHSLDDDHVDSSDIESDDEEVRPNAIMKPSLLTVAR